MKSKAHLIQLGLILSFLPTSEVLAQTAPWYHSLLDLEPGALPRARSTVVAVIDTGIDQAHPALRSSLWVNTGESGLDDQGRDKKTNGVDDDRNGFIDDVHGWNFAKHSARIDDDHGHGTHIAGLIAGESPDFHGVAPGTRLMILKYYDAQAPIGGNLMNSVRAIRYAVSMGAHILNYSGGGLEPHPEERRALEDAAKKGVLVVAAAGNENTNADALGFYPASYGLQNILSVMAVGPDRKRLPASNWGQRHVHLAAPGEAILSTYLNGQMAYMSGTSQATALVTGVAVLLREKHAELKSPEALIRWLTQSGRFNSHLVGKSAHPQMLSVRRALAMESHAEDERPEVLSTYRPFPESPRKTPRPSRERSASIVRP
ncbi:MAG: S8 family peptidase [Bdellovibrionales bacterium]